MPSKNALRRIAESDRFGPTLDRLWPRSLGLSPWRQRKLIELTDPIAIKEMLDGLRHFAKTAGPDFHESHRKFLDGLRKLAGSIK